MNSGGEYGMNCSNIGKAPETVRNFLPVMRPHRLLTSTILLAILLLPAEAVAARRGATDRRPSARSINTEARTSEMNEFVEQRHQERLDRTARKNRSGPGTGRLGTGQGVLRLQRSGNDRPSRRDINWRANPDRVSPIQPTNP